MQNSQRTDAAFNIKWKKGRFYYDEIYQTGCCGTHSFSDAGRRRFRRWQSANNETPSTGSDNEGTKVYKIVADNSFAPFDFMDPDTMEYTGIDMDLLRCYRRGSGL